MPLKGNMKTVQEDSDKLALESIDSWRKYEYKVKKEGNGEFERDKAKVQRGQGTNRFKGMGSSPKRP